MSQFRRSFMKHWFAVEAIPIYAVVGVVVAGGTWYLARLARGPQVVWTKSNPTPWNDIKPDEGTKLLTVNQHFEKRYARTPLSSPSTALTTHHTAGSGESCKASRRPTVSALPGAEY
ncbi:hypothetical protein BV20DRAFT_957683 [Pilatotrama ljubarskyi]|nr:hypothetical protein BV20DRAFT_957683 [Pilatotrama ljubarskyi]